jgi:Skp family chaperone for outer membrane proteins
MISSRQRLLWAGLLASAAFAASAQTPPAAPTAPTAGAQSAQVQPGPRAERGDPAKRFEHMKEQRAKRLSALKEKLKLNASQEGAWSTFADAQQPPPRPAQHMQREEFAKMTTPQRLDLMQQRQAERAAMFSKRADATRSFYAGLTPEQQQTFDAETARMGRGPHDHGGPHGHRPPPPAKG